MNATGAPEPAGVSTRRDTESGVREEVGFLGPDGRKLFYCLHMPPGEIQAGLLICSSIHAEQVMNYRREVLLARRAAASGIAVLRFHYLGSGNSDGDTTDLTFGSMIEDTGMALEHLSHHLQGQALAVMGTRLGALIAARITSDTPQVPVILWEPVVDGTGFWREVFRVGSMRDLRQGKGSSGSPRERLEASGAVDILGYPITRTIHDEVAGLDLDSILGTTPRRLLLAQIGPWSQLRKDRQELVERWESRGFDVTTLSIEQKEAWWFPRIPHIAEESVPGNKEIVERTVAWISEKTGRTS